MKISESKSIYPISKLKYLWTMLTGRHFVVTQILNQETKEEIEETESLLTVNKDCLILTILDPSILSANKRTPIIIKTLAPEGMNVAQINPFLPQGMEVFTDENGESVMLTRNQRLSCLTLKVGERSIFLRLQR